MKKYIRKILIVTALALVLCPFLTKADGVDVNYSISSSSTDVYPGSEFNIYVNVSGAVNGIASNTINLNYDTSKFQFVSASAPYPSQPGDVSTNDTGGKIVFLYVDTGGGTNPLRSENVAIFTFRALNSIGTGSFSFTVDGTADADTNNYNIVTASGSTNVNVIPVPEVSSNNYLSSLSVSGGTLSPAFNRDTLSYNVTVDDVATNIYATAEDGAASVQGLGYATLNLGLNTYYVTVIAPNGAQRTYTLNITRPIKGSTDISLSSLSVSDTNIKFNGGAYYTATVENDVKKVTIKATANDGKTTISGTGDYFLSVGENTFVVTAVSESGISASYNIIITRNSKNNSFNNSPTEEDANAKNNYLKSLNITGANFAFNKDTLNYVLTVPYSQEKLEINYETDSSYATVKIIAEDILKVGSNNVLIEVIATNGDVKTYQIIITRNDEMPITEFNSEALLNALDSDGDVATQVSLNSESILLEDVVVTKLRETQKKLRVNLVDDFGNINGQIIIDGKNIANEGLISLKFSNTITDDIFKLDSPYFAINTNESNIPMGTVYRYFVDSFKDNYNLYFISDGKLATKQMPITNGYLEFTIDNNASYAISKSLPEEEKQEENKTDEKSIIGANSDLSKWFYFGGGTLAIAGATVGALYIVNKKRKNVIDNNPSVDYLDLEPESPTVVAPVQQDTNIETIPAADALNINMNLNMNTEPLPSEPEVELLTLASKEIEEENTGMVENYQYANQEEHNQEENIEQSKADLDQLLDPKYEIRPILSAEAIADNFIDAKIEFDFEPAVQRTFVTTENSQNLVTPETQVVKS